MIVRDEQAVIEETLRAALPLIGTWTVIDTGSVDDTPAIVQRVLGDVPGTMLHRPWVDFGTNRSELFAESKGSADHLMLLDADMVVRLEGSLPDLAGADVWSGVVEHGPIEYQLPIVVDGGRDWRYEGVAHSFLACDGAYTQDVIPGLRVAHKGRTTVAKLERDLALLSAEHARNPLHARTVFYLAQTYRDLGRIPEAIHFYRVRADMRGWDEETFYARYRLGCLLAEHVSFEKGSVELLAAWRMRPHRAEPLRALSRSAGNVADKIPYPDADRLFVHRGAYQPQTSRWDAWRVRYATMGVDEQRAAYDGVYVSHRDQARFDADALAALLTHTGAKAVVELGGWDGALAATILATFPAIESWTNYEISSAAVAASVCHDPRYDAVALDDWYWNDRHDADVFVASHVIEHLSFADLRKTFDATAARWLYVQSPLEEGPTDWTGYEGTHILEVGWAAIDADLAARGYRLMAALSGPHVRCYEATSPARDTLDVP